MGDLGRLPLQAKLFNNNINYLKYLTNKDNISLVKQAYLYEKRISVERITIKNSLHKLSTQYAPPGGIPNVIAESRRSLKKKINKLFEEKWRTKLNLSPKADTFKIFKLHPKFEKCFAFVANHKHLTALVKLRVSDHQLMIEKGRRHRLPLARHERLCEECGVLGDEIHFLTVCLKFNNQRKILYQIVNNAVPNFENIDSLAKFIFLLSQEDVVITRALAKYTFECSKIIENGNT